MTNTLTGKEYSRPIQGNTYPVKDQLKALGAKWNPEYKSWFIVDSKLDEANRIVGSVQSTRPVSNHAHNAVQNQCDPRDNDSYDWYERA